MSATAAAPADLAVRTGGRSIESLFRAAQEILAREGLTISPSRLSRRIRAYQARPTGDLAAWVIAYADPTGETAVRNVMRGTR